MLEMTRITARLIVLFFALALLVATVGGSAFASHRASPNVPNPGSSDRLNGVSALSPTAAWAVGSFFNGTSEQTLVLRWKGTSWKVSASPSPGGTHGSSLSAVSADSASDAWAVGFFNDGSRTNTLALHWNGSSWTQVTVPDPGVSQALLTGVVALSPTNAWAVGTFFDGSQDRTLIVHWNGATWTQVTSPNVAGNDFLNAIGAHSATDMWAVGQVFDSGVTSTLILHWDGGAWSVVPSPNPGSGNDDELTGVSANAKGNAWAVGQFFAGVGGSSTLILRWNGSNWTQVTSPNPGTSGNFLTGTSIVSKNNAWAVGFQDSGSTQSTVILHWDGVNWTQVPSPSPGPRINILNAVSADSASDAWAAGWDAKRAGKNLLLHWNGATWTAAP
jgi:hypothetical protein